METASVREWRIDRERAAERKHRLRAGEREGERREGELKRLGSNSPPGGCADWQKATAEGGRRWEGREGGGGGDRMVKLREEVETERVALCDKK